MNPLAAFGEVNNECISFSESSVYAQYPWVADYSAPGCVASALSANNTVPMGCSTVSSMGLDVNAKEGMKVDPIFPMEIESIEIDASSSLRKSESSSLNQDISERVVKLFEQRQRARLNVLKEYHGSKKKTSDRELGIFYADDYVQQFQTFSFELVMGTGGSSSSNSNSGSLSGGAVAGIVLGTLAFLIMGGIGFVILVFGWSAVLRSIGMSDKNVEKEATNMEERHTEMSFDYGAKKSSGSIVTVANPMLAQPSAPSKPTTEA